MCCLTLPRRCLGAQIKTLETTPHHFSLQQVICTAIGIAVLALVFFGKAQEESRLAYVTVMAVSPQQLHLFFYALRGQLQR